MEPEEWAEIFEAGCRAAGSEGKAGSAVNALALALAAMQEKAQEIAQRSPPNRTFA